MNLASLHHLVVLALKKELKETQMDYEATKSLIEYYWQYADKLHGESGGLMFKTLNRHKTSARKSKQKLAKLRQALKLVKG